MTGQWEPLSVRLGQRSPVRMADGVPEWLENPLWDWIEEFFVAVPMNIQVALAEQLGLELQLPLAKMTTAPPFYRIRMAAQGDRDRALDVAEWLVLRLHPLDAAPPSLSGFSDHLERILRAAGSRWRVSAGGRLEQRVDPTVVAAADAAKAAAEQGSPSAAAHLAGAWAALYGRSSDPGLAIDEAIRAVEAAAKPLVINTGTLSDVIKGLTPTGRWVLPMPLTWEARGQPMTTDPGPILAGLAQVVWHGKGERHGGSNSHLPRTHEQAETVITVAVALVHLLSAGLVSRQG